jgi:hypothetical protein
MPSLRVGEQAWLESNGKSYIRFPVSKHIEDAVYPAAALSLWISRPLERQDSRFPKEPPGSIVTLPPEW